MRIGFAGFRHGLIVLSTIYGMSIPRPVFSQEPASGFNVVEATIDGIHAAMRSAS